VYLDSAATAQKPQVVIDSVNELHTTMNANIHRGIHYLAEQTTSRYEASRELIRQFIGARSTAEIIFTSGATASINLVAYSFGERFFQSGDNIVLTQMEHHSNIVPWQLIAERKGVQIRVLPINEDGSLQVEKLQTLIDERTKIVSLTQTSNVLGTNNDLQYIISVAHAASVPVMVDGCQGMVHSSINVTDLDIDFYAFSGHKLYGPTGIGVLYGKECFLEQMPPYMGGGDMIRTVSFKGTTYADLPLKFEAGTSNFIGAIALGVAVNYVQLFEPKLIHDYEDSLARYFTSALLSAIDGVKIYGTTATKAPIVSFCVDGTFPMDVAMIIDKLGVAIRSGTHCAEPLMQFYGVESMCRASFAMYNTIKECDQAVEAIVRATKMLRG
ncbi:MAG: cysteine desulfurase, partial [Mucinivorans sp.]